MPYDRQIFNTLSRRLDSRRFAGNVLKWMFLNEIYSILNQIPIKFPSNGLTSNVSHLAHIMAVNRREYTTIVR